MANYLLVKLEKFFQKYHKLTLRKGYSLLLSNENPEGVYFIKKGSVRQYSISSNGEEITIHIYFKGSYFPLIWAYLNIPNSHNFEAYSDSILYLAPKNEVIEFLNNNSDIQNELIKRLLSGLFGMTKRVETTLTMNAKNRVISALIYLGKHFGKKQKSELKIENKFTHEDFAKFTGLTRETVSKSLEELSKEKIISTKGHLITISDFDKLEEQIIP